jgi:hypothetical protein
VLLAPAVVQDLETEYVTFSADNSKAYVIFQVRWVLLHLVTVRSQLVRTAGACHAKARARLPLLQHTDTLPTQLG